MVLLPGDLDLDDMGDGSSRLLAFDLAFRC